MSDAEKLEALSVACTRASESAEALHLFVQHCYENGWILTDFDWQEWQAEALALSKQPDGLATADVLTLSKLLTTDIRKDRFVEGHLASMVECRLLDAIGRRARALAFQLRHGVGGAFDGSTPLTAIPVAGVAAEYDWLRNHRPGFALVVQRLESHECGPRDHMVLRSDIGEEAHCTSTFPCSTASRRKPERRHHAHSVASPCVQRARSNADTVGATGMSNRRLDNPPSAWHRCAGPALLHSALHAQLTATKGPLRRRLSS